jgi:polyferredoxin
MRLALARRPRLWHTHHSMQPERLPFAKIFDTPLWSLDQTSMEMASIVFLFLAVVVIARARKRRQLLRHLVQLAAVAVFFLLIYSCLGVFGMIRNGLYGLTLLGSVYSEALFWLALPTVILSVTLLWGPVFCGWICPTGTLQELASWVRKVVGKRAPYGLRPKRSQMLALAVLLTGYLSLMIAIASEKEMFVEDSSLHWAAALLLLCYLIVVGVIDDLPTRRLRALSVLAIVLTAVSHVTITSPVHFAFTARNDPASALSTLVVAAASMVISRAWCRYLCPWGYVLGFLHRHSRLKLVRTIETCTHCHTCVAVCDVGAMEPDRIRHEHCQFCFRCIDECPGRALAVVEVWQSQDDAQGVPPHFVPAALGGGQGRGCPT